MWIEQTHHPADQLAPHDTKDQEDEEPNQLDILNEEDEEDEIEEENQNEAEEGNQENDNEMSITKFLGSTVQGTIPRACHMLACWLAKVY